MKHFYFHFLRTLVVCTVKITSTLQMYVFLQWKYNVENIKGMKNAFENDLIKEWFIVFEVTRTYCLLAAMAQDRKAHASILVSVSVSGEERSRD